MENGAGIQAVEADAEEGRWEGFCTLLMNNIRRRLRTVLTEAGIEGVTPHSFRRTVATVIDRAGGADLAAEMLGHTSSEITKAHYIEPEEKVNPVTAEILESLSPRRLAVEE